MESNMVISCNDPIAIIEFNNNSCVVVTFR